MRNKITGMLVGGAIGDAWGMPVESMSPDEIAEKHPFGLKSYEPAVNHKWLGDYGAGNITDDTYLTIATLVALLEEGLNMKAMAECHVIAHNNNTVGWGRTTRTAIGLLAKGHSWHQTGKMAADPTASGKKLVGNGILMKCSPLGAYRAVEEVDGRHFNQFCVHYSAMTHYNKMAAYSGIIHANAIDYILKSDIEHFDTIDFLDLVCNRIWKWAEDKEGENYFDVTHLDGILDPLYNQFSELWKLRHELPKMTAEELRKKFKTSGYIVESMPFSYAMFAKNPYSAFDAGFDTIHQGGDTDSNAKVVLEMIGALHGLDVFRRDQSEWMIKGLFCFDRMMKSAEAFCDNFGVER